MNKTIRISIVNYTNTLPFKWALRRSEIINNIDLQEDIPSICAQKLKFRQVDLALVPVALLAEIEDYHIVSNYCIGADGKVDSVKLYSTVPLEHIRQITLDYQSRSSIALTRILCSEYWKITPVFKDALPGFEDKHTEGEAQVVIGDRTFSLNGTFPYEYDLAEEWKKFTGLPFVFAAWVSNEPLNKEFLSAFDRILSEGIRNIPASVNEANELAISNEIALEYLTQRISYPLDERKRKGMELFLKYLRR